MPTLDLTDAWRQRQESRCDDDQTFSGRRSGRALQESRLDPRFGGGDGALRGRQVARGYIGHS